MKMRTEINLPGEPANDPSDHYAVSVGAPWRDRWIGPLDWRGDPQCPSKDGVPWGSHRKDWRDGEVPEGMELYEDIWK